MVDVYDSAETQGMLESDLQNFTADFSLPGVSPEFAYPVPAGNSLNTSGSDGWALEEALDLEWAHASAPGASITMALAANTNAALYGSVDALVAEDQVNVLSLSWGEPDVGIYNEVFGGCTSGCNASSDGSYAMLHPVLAAAAVEGISVFVASGDCGAADGTNGVSTDYPASDPWTTGVGGIRASGWRFVIDPMYGAGRGCLARLFGAAEDPAPGIHEAQPALPGHESRADRAARRAASPSCGGGQLRCRSRHRWGRRSSGGDGPNWNFH